MYICEIRTSLEAAAEAASPHRDPSRARKTFPPSSYRSLPPGRTHAVADGRTAGNPTGEEEKPDAERRRDQLPWSTEHHGLIGDQQRFRVNM